MDGSISLCLNETSTNGSLHFRVQCRSPVLYPQRGAFPLVRCKGGIRGKFAGAAERGVPLCIAACRVLFQSSTGASPCQHLSDFLSPAVPKGLPADAERT
jgi:hypothetical protein